MTAQIEALAATTAPAALTRSFVLDAPVTLGDRTIIEAGVTVTVRKPASGALRGLSLLSLCQMDVTALETLAPRVTSPTIVKGASLDPADLMQFGTEVLDFLLPKSAREQVSPTA
jgi:hypothetical protein